MLRYFILFVTIGLVCFLVGYVCGCETNKRKYSLFCEKERTRTLRVYWENKLEQNHYNLEQYFCNRGWTKIVIYGLGVEYEGMMQFFDPTKLEQVILGDKNGELLSRKLKTKVYNIEELKNINFDAVVVSSSIYYLAIKKEFEDADIMVPIISYEDLIYNAGKEC